MALFFRKYQDKSSNEAKNGKWYARAVVNDTIEIEELARRMQDNCTVKRADILAVLSELGPTVKDLMHESKRVRIPYLGAFKLGINTTAAESREKFTVNNIKKAHVLFQPAITAVAGTRSTEWVQELKFKEWGSNTSESTTGSNTGDNTGSNTGDSSDDPIDVRP